MEISEKRYAIAQDAEKNSHILKKDIGIFERRLKSAEKGTKSYIEHIEKLLGKESSHSLIDVGSGPTCVGRFFKADKKFYVDPLMAFFKEYYEAGVLPADGELVTAKAETLPYESDSFDIAISYNMIDHTHRPLAIASEIERVLKPGGYLLFGIYTHNPIMKAIRFLAEKSWVFKERPHPYSYTFGDAKKMFANMKTVVCDQIQGEESIFNFKRRYYIFILQKK